MPDPLHGALTASFRNKQVATVRELGQIDVRALSTGIGAAAIGTAIFSVFLFLYLQLDHSLMRSIARREPLGLYLNPYIAAFMVSLEGLFSGIFVTFLLSNFMAERRHVNRPRETEVIQ